MKNAISCQFEVPYRFRVYFTEGVFERGNSVLREVLREGVRLVQEREAKLAALDAALARGLADVEAGRVMRLDEAFDRLRQELKLPKRTR